MDFGRVEYSKLAEVNFKLPKEPYTNSTVLKNKVSQPRFYVGLSRWGRKEWIGKLYPKGTREKDFPTEYAKHFNAIEFNATHYKLSSDQDIERWKEKVDGSNLIFCPKVYQGISHFGSFDDKQFLTDTFLSNMRKFGKHLGPVFLQLSDKFGPKRKEELIRYLSSLPKDIQFFLEVRHEDFFKDSNSDELFTSLMKLKIGSIITDTAGRRDAVHLHLTVPKIFIRFVANNLHETDFKRLDEWALRIKYWVETGLEEVYFFVHCLDESFAPELSQYLVKQLNEKCNAGLKPIKLNQA
jgi:uncharacterized protein YecE (DUF72 family)